MIGLLSSPSAVLAADEVAARRASSLEGAQPTEAPIDAVHQVESAGEADTAGARHDHSQELTTDERLRQQEALQASRDDAEAVADEEKTRELQARDSQVRRHEQAHAAAGGGLSRAPTYRFERGPDGRSYAVDGEVSIETSREPDPDATIEKMRQVRRAALAPSDPSPQDRSVAAKAAHVIRAAEAELAARRQETLRDAARTLEEVRDAAIVDEREAAQANDAALGAPPPPAAHHVTEYQRHAVLSAGSRLSSLPPPPASFDSNA